MIPYDENLMRLNTPRQEIAKLVQVGAEVQNGLHSMLLPISILVTIQIITMTKIIDDKDNRDDEDEDD